MAFEFCKDNGFGPRSENTDNFRLYLFVWNWSLDYWQVIGLGFWQRLTLRMLVVQKNTL
jgi:hypothetical protein